MNKFFRMAVVSGILGGVVSPAQAGLIPTVIDTTVEATVGAVIGTSTETSTGTSIETSVDTSAEVSTTQGLDSSLNLEISLEGTETCSTCVEELAPSGELIGSQELTEQIYVEPVPQVPVYAIPEPGSVALVVLGIWGIVMTRRREARLQAEKTVAHKNVNQGDNDRTVIQRGGTEGNS